MTLLEKAKQIVVDTPSRACKDEAALRQKAELMLAWVNGEITSRQVAGAIGGSSNCIQARMAGILITAIRKGIVRAEMVPK